MCEYLHTDKETVDFSLFFFRREKITENIHCPLARCLIPQILLILYYSVAVTGRDSRAKERNIDPFREDLEKSSPIYNGFLYYYVLKFCC